MDWGFKSRKRLRFQPVLTATVVGFVLSGGELQRSGAMVQSPPSLDLREPMRLAAQAIVRRLDPAQDFRPWFLLRGQGGVPVRPEHASWDLGDMTGPYL